jgi:hypothetical protein
MLQHLSAVGIPLPMRTYLLSQVLLSMHLAARDIHGGCTEGFVRDKEGEEPQDGAGGVINYLLILSVHIVNKPLEIGNNDVLND